MLRAARGVTQEEEEEQFPRGGQYDVILPQPEDITQAMLAEDIPLHDYANLVLLGHGGRRLWQALTAFGMKTAAPVDHFSLVMTRRFIDEFLGAPPEESEMMGPLCWPWRPASVYC